MLNTNEDALICDLAETYGIYDYRSLPLRTVATLSVGLRENSRTMLEMSGQKHPANTLLLASIADSCALLVYSKTEDAEHNINRPKSFFEALVGTTQDTTGFDTPEEFEEARKRILGG